MKYKTSVQWCELSDMMVITVSEVAEYEFNYDATQDALNILHNLRLLCATEAGLGWSLLYRAKAKLETEVAEYFSGK